MQSDLAESTSSPFSSPRCVSGFFHPQIFLILLLCNFLLHGWVLTGYFQADDWYNVEPRSVSQVLQTFAGDWHVGRQGIGGFYRPLVRVSFSLDTLLYGMWAPGYHLTNFLLHVVTVYLFFLLCSALLGNQSGALGTALVFSAFPTHPEAIFWLSGRTDLMAAGFLMLCVWSYARYRLEQRRGAYGVALAAFAGTLMSKETGVAGILLLGVFELLYNSRKDVGAQTCSGTAPSSSYALSWIRPLIPFLFIVMCYVFVRFLFLGGIGGYAIRPGEQAVGFSTLAQTYNAFANTLAAPFRWCLPLLSKSGLLGFLIVGLVLMWATNFNRAVVFGFLWVLISIIPMLKLLPTMSEGGRLVYLPAAGFCMVLGFAFWHGVQSQRVWLGGRIMIGAIFLFVVLGGFIYQSVQRNFEWKHASSIARMIAAQGRELIRESGADKRFALIGAPDNYRGCFVFRGDSPIQAFRLLLDDPALKLHVGFDPSDDSQTVVLHVDHSYNVHREAIQQIVRHHWSGEDLLAWTAGEGLLPLKIQDGIAETAIISQPFSGLESPPLRMEDMWVLVMLKQEVTGGQYGKIYWRGPEAQYREERTTLIYNDHLNVFENHRRNLGYMERLEQLLIKPTDSYSRVAIEKIDVIGYRLAAIPASDIGAKTSAGE